MATRGRNNLGKFTRTKDTAERDAAACRLWDRGDTLQAIADTLGFCDRAAVNRAIKRSLKDTQAAPAGMVRDRQMRRLDEMYRAALAVLETEHVTVSQGRVVCDTDGAVVPDDAPVLAAIDRMIRIEARMAELMGLDAPKRSRVEVVTEDAIDAQIAVLEAQIAAADAAGDRRPAGEAATPPRPPNGAR